MFDLISIGDATLDHVFRIHDAHLAFSIKKEIKELCVNYGEKIAVDEYHEMVAGNNANNAVGSARLNLKTAAYINVGSDNAGFLITNKLKEEKVNTKYLVVNQGMHSNSSAVIEFQGERTILVYHQPWKYNLPDLDNTKWIYFSSLCPSFPDSLIIDQIASFVERTQARLAFNPGTYQIKYGVKKMQRLLSLVSVLIVNKQEAETILGFEKSVNIKKLLQGLSDLGPKMVVITDGKEGSYGYVEETFYKLGIFPAKALHVTGAGDAYGTGLMAGLFYGHDLPESMRWGTANSASVIEKFGPQDGLLTYNEMQEKLKEHAKIIAKEI